MNVLDDRVRVIGKINGDIADWLAVSLVQWERTDADQLQERRKVEEAYATNLKRLASRRPHEASDQLG